MDMCNIPLKYIQHSVDHLIYKNTVLQLEQSSFSNEIHNSFELRPQKYPGILDVDLTALTLEQRLAFRFIVCLLCCLSLCGNISTFVVNLKRKMRPFFRSCLISLAISDLLNTIFSATVYLAQLSTEYAEVWILGRMMCSLVQFATTTAILTSSMTLVVIALDRYIAVMKTFISKWKPGHASGVTCMSAIWILAFCISCPVFYIYRMISVYIINEIDIESDVAAEQRSWPFTFIEEPPSYSLVQPEQFIMMCVSEKRDVALYYIIVFGIIFAPCILAFVWLNAAIAKEIWIRRHKVSQNHWANERSNAHSLSTNKGNPKEMSTASDIKATAISGSGKPRNMRSNREARHLRMVIVLILLITIFLGLRLPAWIFLLMRMYGSYEKTCDWLGYFIFGILNLTSCALNPLFYTFLHETIQYILCCKVGCQMRRRRVKRCISECNCRSFSDCTNASVQNVICCACFGVFCGIFRTCPNTNKPQKGSISNQKKASTRSGNSARCAGVVCNDNSTNGNGNEFVDNKSSKHNENLKERIFTVYSMSLMAASDNPRSKSNTLEKLK